MATAPARILFAHHKLMQQRLLPKPQGDQIRLPSATLRLKSVQNRQSPVRQADHRLDPLMLIGVVEVDLDPHLLAGSLFLRCRAPLIDPGQSMRQRQPAAQVRLEVPVQLLLRSSLTVDRPRPELQFHPFPAQSWAKVKYTAGRTVEARAAEPSFFTVLNRRSIFSARSFPWALSMNSSHCRLFSGLRMCVSLMERLLKL